MKKKFLKLYERFREIINYLIVGILTTIVSLAVYYGCVISFLDPKFPIQLQIANIISWIAAVTFAYFTNRKFVFRSNTTNYWKEAMMFYSSRLITLFLDMTSMFLLVIIGGLNDKISKLIVQVLVTIGNYLLSKFIVFQKANSRRKNK